MKNLFGFIVMFIFVLGCIKFGTNILMESQYKSFNGYWTTTDALAEGSDFRIKGKKLYEITNKNIKREYGLKKDGFNYVIDKNDIPEDSFLFYMYQANIENTVSGSETDVIYITGTGDLYNYQLPLYREKKSNTKFKNNSSGIISKISIIIIIICSVSLGLKKGRQFS